MAMTLDELAGLGEDPSDLMSDSNPYVRLAEARRLRTSRLTPGGLPQPPEVMGVDTDVRTPNRFQPMPGEFDAGGLVNEGKPGFHNPSMPPSNGLANQSMTSPGQMQGASTASGRRLTGIVRRGSASLGAAPAMMPHPAGVPFGAPTGTTSLEALAGLPPLQDDAYPLAALPHFADGGVLPPGGTGVVGDATGNAADEEVVHALPGGGARVTPVDDRRLALAALPEDFLGGSSSVRHIPSGAPTTAKATPSIPKAPSIYASQIAGLPDDTPTRAELLAGLGPVNYGRPPEETSATDRYQKALGEFEPGGDLSADKAPRPGQYKAHGWRRVLGDIAGVAAGALSFSPGAGMLVHDAITGEPYRQGSEEYERQRRLALAALPELQESAQMESQQNASRQNQYNADRTFNEQQWKDQQNAQNEQARIQAERDKAAAQYPPLPAGPDLATPDGRRQYAAQHPETVSDLSPEQRDQWYLTGHIGSAPRPAHAPAHRGPSAATEHALAAIAAARSPEEAQSLLAAKAAEWERNGVDLAEVQRFINSHTASARHDNKSPLTMTIGGRQVNLGGPPAAHTPAAAPPAVGDVRTFKGNSYRFDGREWVRQ